LGHVAVQYAKAMGMHVAAIDVADDKLDLAKKLGQIWLLMQKIQIPENICIKK
jgi:propanol-preferring alcohol dehydrogenase